jgi:hypothetical protein
LNNLYERLPFFTRGSTIQATDIYLITPEALSGAALVLVQLPDEFPFDIKGPTFGKMQSVMIKDNDVPVKSRQLKLPSDLPAEMTKCWLTIRYIMR